MKRVLVLVAAVLLISGIGYAQGITGSAHDFSGAAWNTAPGLGEICMPCHTPHNADPYSQGITDAPLWNHLETVTTFTLYDSPTFDGTTTSIAGVSRLCLSCHDGVVALDSFGGATGSTPISGVANFGTDLSNDHPVSFSYNAALASTDGGLYDPTTVSSNIPDGGTISEDMLFSNTMECASCHDVHNATAFTYLLLKDNAGSDLCLTCHNK